LGRKVHPLGFRIGVIRDWQARWYADTHYADSVKEDLKLRQAIQQKYPDAAISLVEIERQAKEVSVAIHTARPGIVIGRGGQRVDELSSHLEKIIGRKVRLNIQEIRQPELDANLVAKTIAEQIQRRIAYRRAMKQAIFRTIQAGAKGIRVSCSGRLGDSEIARRQTMHEGQVPLHTLRADIDYGFTEARTTLGRIGVKVWIYKGEILPEPKELEIEEAPAEPEGKPAEPVATESVEPAAEATTEEKPARPVTRKKKAAAAEPKGKPAEPVAAKSAEPAAEVTTEEKPARPKTRKKKAAAAEPEEKPAAKVTTEEKPARPVTRKKKAAAAEPAKPKTRKKKAAAAEPEEKPAAEATTEEKPAKPKTRKKKAETAEDTATEA